MKHILLLITLATALCAPSFSQTDTLYLNKHYYQHHYNESIGGDNNPAYFRPAPLREGKYYRVLTYFMNGKLHSNGLSKYPYSYSCEGLYYSLNENGDTLAIANYKNGELDGEYRQYYDNGKLKCVLYYQKGLEHGMHIHYHENGKIKEQVKFVNGIPDGTWQKFTSSGKLKADCNFTNGKIDGKYFDSETHLEFRGNFSNGNLIDYFIYKDKNSLPIASAKSIDGIEHWKFYNGDTLILECFYKDGKRFGEWKRYSPDGKAIAEIIDYSKAKNDCSDSPISDISHIESGHHRIPSRFEGLIGHLYMYCTTAKFKRFDVTGKLIANGNMKQVKTIVEKTPNELQYPELFDYFTFYEKGGTFNPPGLRPKAVAPIEINSNTSNESHIFTIVEQSPEFPGGDDSLWQYLKTNFVYPPKVVELAIEGKVLVRFVISADGKVENVTVLRGLQTDIDAEVVRVVKSLPPFKPGRQQGKPVAVYFSLPVPVKMKN